jgi:hypothetical protein
MTFTMKLISSLSSRLFRHVILFADLALHLVLMRPMKSLWNIMDCFT